MRQKIFLWSGFAIAIVLNVIGVYVYRRYGSINMFPILTWSGAFVMLITVIARKKWKPKK